MAKSLDAKIEYLKTAKIPEEVIEYIKKNEEKIHSKLIVWFAHQLMKLSDEEKKNINSLKIHTEENKIIIPHAITIKVEWGEREQHETMHTSIMEAYSYVEDWYLSTREDISKLDIYEAYKKSALWHEELKNVDHKTIKYKEIIKDNV